MRKRVKSATKRRGKAARSRSVGRLFGKQKSAAGDTALEIVEVYEAVERSYRAAVMAGESHAGIAYSTNY